MPLFSSTTKINTAIVNIHRLCLQLLILKKLNNLLYLKISSLMILKMGSIVIKKENQINLSLLNRKVIHFID